MTSFARIVIRKGNHVCSTTMNQLISSIFLHHLLYYRRNDAELFYWRCVKVALWLRIPRALSRSLTRLFFTFSHHQHSYHRTQLLCHWVYMYNALTTLAFGKYRSANVYLSDHHPSGDNNSRPMFSYYSCELMCDGILRCIMHKVVCHLAKNPPRGRVQQIAIIAEPLAIVFATSRAGLPQTLS